VTGVCIFEDMLEACRRIEQYAAGLGRDQLITHGMAYDAVLPI
jgi:uncharacterized protein with HEPN domain